MNSNDDAAGSALANCRDAHTDPVIPARGRKLTAEELDEIIQQYSLHADLMYKDAETVGSQTVASRVWYTFYARFTTFALMVTAVSAFPLLYFVHSHEYRVWRLRNPSATQTYYKLGVSLLLAASCGAVVAVSPLGFKERKKVANRVMRRYDEVAWDARLFRSQLLARSPDLKLLDINGGDEVVRRYKGLLDRMRALEEHGDAAP